MKYLLFAAVAALLVFNASAATSNKTSTSSSGSWQIDGIFPPTG